jgi:hypothetical protein
VTVYVADAHEDVQRLVLVVKMATVLEKCITEGKLLLCDICGQKDSKQRIFAKKYLLFAVGSVCFGSQLGSKRFADDEEVEVRKWLRRQLKGFYVTGFDTVVKR